MEDKIRIATEEEIRQLNTQLKPPIPKDVLEFVDYNNRLQLQAINDNFEPCPIYEKYNEKYNWNTMVNAISSAVYKNRVGRQLKLTIRDEKYKFIYGFIGLGSPVLNNQITNYFKNTNINFDFSYFNNHVAELFICIGTGILTKYLSGKLLVYISFSKEIFDLYNNSYNTNIKILFTTSLYGKSSIYNRIKELQYLGLSSGYNSLFDKEQTKWILNTYKQIFPNRNQKKTAKAIHIIRLYEHLYKHFNGEMPFYPVKTQRGVYIFDSNITPIKTFSDNVDFWKNRWYYPRKNRLSNTESNNFSE